MFRAARTAKSGRCRRSLCSRFAHAAHRNFLSDDIHYLCPPCLYILPICPECLRVNGVGHAKLERYGQVFLDVLNEFQSDY